jgi:hypothetical protein
MAMAMEMNKRAAHCEFPHAQTIRRTTKTRKRILPDVLGIKSEAKPAKKCRIFTAEVAEDSE